MKVIKKINNNVAIGRDGNQRDVIIMGKGVGFPSMPYELTDMSRITRTFYDIDSRYYELLKDIPEEIFLIVSSLLERAKLQLPGNLNPNLVFVLADHINFAVERNRKGLNVGLMYSYEMEYQYPQITKVAKWFVQSVNEQMGTTLEKGEVTSITVHFLDAMEGNQSTLIRSADDDRVTRIVTVITHIVEEYFHIEVNQNSFHYFRFKNHLKFFVQRKEKGDEFSGQSIELYEGLRQMYTQVAECVSLIDDFLKEEFGERCPKEELLYLMMHVNQLCSKEENNT